MRKQILTTIAAVILLAGLPLNGMAANKKTSVDQVTAPVTVSDDVDYTVTSATPFAEGGTIDITNTDHAVVILSSVKPSAAIRLLAAHVTINGQKAVNNTNCQVKLYNLGAIILPYGNSTKPLTVYSEPDFGGTAVSDFGTEHSGGYMNTLTDAKLNNKIRSFRLKRGYMVTFSTLPSGRGYSRCFIAADGDLEVASLPAVLDSRISSYRVFKWYDAGKKQLANDMTTSHLAALNVQSSYTWSQGQDLAPDYECVPNHIYEDWPSSASIGQATWSPHTKNNNEPRNSNDDHPQDLATILGNWENMMRTGMRLCSPASWDGSDYRNATGFLADFLDSIDARGWRCDIIDLHCYWDESNFGNIKNWVDKYKRPVWISEWCWGASWHSNGAFASGVTETQVKSALQRICTNLNSWNYVERYYYWNSERDPSRLYKDGKLTPAGEYYASMNSGLGYNGKYDFVPTSPRQYAPSAFSVTFADGTATIKWHDQNGEYNQLMQLERKLRGGQWELLTDIEQKEQAANYTYTDEHAPDGTQYRLHLIDLNGTSYYTNNDMEPGDAVIIDGENRYAGGNLLTNGDFDLGTLGWTAGTGAEIAQPYFQVVPVGGIDGGGYLQAYGSAAMNTVQSLKCYVAVQPNTDYIFRCASRNGGNNQQLYLSDDEKTTGTLVGRLKNTENWNMQELTFNSGERGYVLIAFNTLQAKAQFDKMELRPLFKTREEAVADGILSMTPLARTVAEYNTVLPQLNLALEGATTILPTLDYEYTDQELERMEQAVTKVLEAIKAKLATDSLMLIGNALKKAGCQLPEALDNALNSTPESYTAEYFINHRQELQQALDEFLNYTDAEVQPQSPNFAATTGWQVKVGTYTGRDQRTNTYGGLTCWNAWWANLNAAEGTKRSMEIRQQVEALPEGLYALECKGSTQHYCLSDQHGYLVYEGDTLATPYLTADYMDLPTVPSIWQTLTTPPVYISEGGSVTIGFVSTKQGAVNNAWHSFGNATNTGDRREGWWCATDFRLLYHPMLKLSVTPGQWSTICLPYASSIPQGAKCYRIAGVLKDYSCICIEELTALEAGMPAIYISDVDYLTFSEYGEKVKSPVSYKAANNLRGYFQTTAAIKAPVGSYVLTDGKWVKVESVRPPIPSNSAIIYKLDGMTELDGWDGLTMPLVEDGTGIDATQVENGQQAGSHGYNLNGMPLKQAPQRGIYIIRQGSKTQKRLVK